MFKTGNVLGKQLCEVFGLDASQINEMSLSIKAGEIDKLHVVLLPTDEQSKQVCELARHYELHERQSQDLT